MKRRITSLLAGTALALTIFASVMMTPASAQKDPIPIAFRQSGQKVLPNAVLHFEYAWQSSTGKLGDLSNCQVGERVDYPGGNPYVWSSPPYVANPGTPNPTVLWVAGTLGVGDDNHTHFDFLAPYKANLFTSLQAYRWRCKLINNGQPTVFDGWGGIQVVRTVANTMRDKKDNCWYYKITKSQLTGQVRPLPGAGPCANAKGAGQEDQETPRADASGSGASFSLPNSSTNLQEPVFLEFTVHNDLAQTVHFDLGLNSTSNFEVTVTDPNGTTVTRQLEAAGFGSSGEVSLDAGEVFSHRLLLNRWNDFAVEGDYKLTVTLLDTIATEQGDVLATNPSQDLYLHVGPQDAQRLAAICHDLADAAINAPTVQEQMDAAQTLSYVNDPVAVPELARVLNQGTFVEQYSVQGLGRIASPQAISALWDGLGHPDPEVRSLVWFTLNSLGQTEVMPTTMD